MSHKKLSPFIVKVSVLGYFPLIPQLICHNKDKLLHGVLHLSHRCK